MTATAYLLLGSNMGNKIRLLQEASALIDRLVGKVVRYSSFYESEPWGFEAEERFMNQALAVNTFLPPEKLLQTTQEIERSLGRTGKQLSTGSARYSSRPIDIDILLYNELVIEQRADAETKAPALTIPHPLMHERLFTLLPLAEIAADLVHPVFGKTIAALLDECPDKSAVLIQS